MDDLCPAAPLHFHNTSFYLSFLKLYQTNTNESVAIAELVWSFHSTLNTSRCSSGAEKVLELLHIVGSFKKGGKAAGQNSLEHYDPKRMKWSKMSEEIKTSDNGGCTVQVSPTDIVVISNYENPGNLTMMHRINLADGVLQNLRSPILEVRGCKYYTLECAHAIAELWVVGSTLDNNSETCVLVILKVADIFSIFKPRKCQKIKIPMCNCNFTHSILQGHFSPPN